MFRSTLLGCLGAFATMAPPALADETDGLEPATLVTAGGQPIDVGHRGHASPFFGDFDGDGMKDLLVGDLSGRMLVFRNEGTNRAPRFVEDDVPFTGRIPTG